MFNVEAPKIDGGGELAVDGRREHAESSSGVGGQRHNLAVYSARAMRVLPRCVDGLRGCVVHGFSDAIDDLMPPQRVGYDRVP